MNIVVLQGVLSSEPRERTLPSGSVLVAWEVTTSSNGAKLTVPVVWFDPPRSAQLIEAGDEVVVLGRVRRRYFASGARTASSTEVVAERATRSGRTREVTKLIDEAIGRLPAAA